MTAPTPSDRTLTASWYTEPGTMLPIDSDHALRIDGHKIRILIEFTLIDRGPERPHAVRIDKWIPDEGGALYHFVTHLDAYDLWDAVSEELISMTPTMIPETESVLQDIYSR